jgi:predicted XRE-type DNA-binding protein
MKSEYFESVWDAIEPDKAVAANLKARADVMIAIQETVKSWRITQAAVAKRLSITQPHLNDLLRGRIDKFSLDALPNLAPLADVTVKVEVVRPVGKANKTGGSKVQRRAA